MGGVHGVQRHCWGLTRILPGNIQAISWEHGGFDAQPDQFDLLY